MKRFASLFSNSRSLAIALLAASYFLLPISGAHAQGVPSNSGGLTISSSVANPRPGQSVTLTASSYTIDLGAASISWTAGGKILGKGTGLSKISVQAPDAGKKLTVNVTAVSPGGISIASSITLASGAVDMIVEPAGYVHPFFRGKTPVAYQNKVKIIAIPHLSNSSGVEYDPANLVYKWEQGSSVLQDQSGYGRQSVVIAGSMVPRPYLVTVTVTTRDGASVGSGSVSVAQESPTVTLYRNDLLYGPLFNYALGSQLYLGTKREAGVLAVPYGFNVPATRGGNLAYSWLINGAQHPELSANRSITARAPDDKPGSSNIRLTISNTEDILQEAGASLSVTWNAAGAQSQSNAVAF